MVSSAGKAIMWSEGEVRAMGRDTMGVKGMTVPADAHVLGMEIAKPGSDLFVITEKGYGKRTSIGEYPEHHRGGQGVFTITMTDKKGLLSVMKIVKPNDEIMIISEEGVVVRTPVSGISELGRSTQGVRVMNVSDKDRVTAVAISSTGKKKRDQKAEGDDVDDIDEIELADEGGAWRRRPRLGAGAALKRYQLLTRGLRLAGCKPPLLFSGRSEGTLLLLWQDFPSFEGLPFSVYAWKSSGEIFSRKLWNSSISLSDASSLMM